MEKWSYEQEYRTHKFYQNPASTEERNIIIPPEAFAEIILGKNMPEEMREDLISLLPEELQGIKIIKQEEIDTKSA